MPIMSTITRLAITVDPVEMDVLALKAQIIARNSVTAHQIVPIDSPAVVVRLNVTLSNVHATLLFVNAIPTSVNVVHTNFIWQR